MANLYASTNNYVAAEALYKEILQIRKETVGIKHLDYAISLNGLAILYRDMGNYDAAESFYKEVLQIYKEVLGEKHLTYIAALNGLALLNWNLGNYATAESIFIKNIAIQKEALGEKHPIYLNYLTSLANVYSDLKNYAAAEALYLKIIETQKEVLGEKHLHYAISLNNLGMVCFYLGKYEASKPLYLQALQIRKEISGEKHPEYTRYLNNLALLHQNLGNYADAERLYKQVMQVRKETLGEKNFGYLTSLNYLAVLHQMLNNYPKALSYYLPMIKGNKDLIAKNFSFLSEKEKENYYQTKIKNSFDYFDAFAITQKNLTAQLYDLQLFSKGILLNSVQKMKNRILNSQDSALIQEYKSWNNLKITLAKYHQMSKEEFAKTGLNLDSLENLANEKEKNLSLKSESFAKISDKKTPTWKDIQAKLKKDEAAIEIVKINKFGVEKIVTDTTDHAYRNSTFLKSGISEFPKYPLHGLTDTIHYAALIVKKQSKEPELVLLTNGNDLEKNAFAFYKNSVRFKKTDPESYKKYWKNIKNNLQGIRKVYFSPDGIYNQINLNILQNPDNQKYIIDEIEIQQLTNTKEILAFADKKDFQNLDNFKATLFGRPAYDMDSVAYLVNLELSKANSQNYALRDMRDLRQGSFSDLLGTEREIVLIDSILKNRKLKTEKYLLSEATEQKIKALQSPNILHIATHGFFIPDSTSKNPMLNSGVLLAGVSNYFRSEEKPDTDDGILTAHEAQNLHLDHTDLVVLSACETGLGEIKNGEGVYGLQRAFKAAGAKSILMSLWKVDDKVTQELMTLFYQKWTKTANKRQSFAEAQKQIRLIYKNPYFWGAFVLVGE